MITAIIHTVNLDTEILSCTLQQQAAVTYNLIYLN